MSEARVLGAEEWMIVGTDPAEALIVRGGAHPVALKISGSGDDLLRLLAEANCGIAAASAEAAPKTLAPAGRRALPAPQKQKTTRKARAPREASGARPPPLRGRVAAEQPGEGEAGEHGSTADRGPPHPSASAFAEASADKSRTPSPPGGEGPGGGVGGGEPAAAAASAVVAGEVRVLLAEGDEEITFRGRAMDLTERQARLAAALAAAMPAPVDRRFLIRKVFGAAAVASSDVVLSTLIGELRLAVAGLGLAVVTIRGVGVAMQPMGETA